MSVSPATEALALFQHYAGALAEATTLNAALVSALHLIESCFQPTACQIIQATPAPVLLAWRGTNQMQPLSPDLRAALERGDVACDGPDEPLNLCFVPLRSQMRLYGWIMLRNPLWGAETSSLLLMLSRQLGPLITLFLTQQQSNARMDRLHTLTDVGRRLSSVLDLDALLEAIAGAIQRVVPASNSYISLYERRTDMLQVAHMIEEGQRVRVATRWKSTEGLTQIVIHQRRAVNTTDYRRTCQEYGIQPVYLLDHPAPLAWLGVPMIARDRIIGMLNVSSYTRDYVYSDEDADLLAMIAGQAAIAIDNAQLYQQSAKQARQLNTLHRITKTITSSLDQDRVPSLIMERVTELLDVEEGSLLLTDNTTGDLVFSYTTGPVGNQLLGMRIPRGVGIAGYVATNGISVMVDDVRHDNRFYAETDQSTGFTTRAILAAPLKGVTGVQGVIEVINRNDGQSFTEEDQRLLESFADQAVIAIENARTFAEVDQALARRAAELASTNGQLQHNLRNLTVLNEFGMAMNTARQSADDVWAMVTRGVMELSDAVGVAVVAREGSSISPVLMHGQTPDASVLMHALEEVGAMERQEPCTALPSPLGYALVVPLTAARKTVGALCVFYRNGLPEPADQEALVLLANQAAGAITAIELFTAVRHARDQMASILASTREGIVLIEADQSVGLANAALHRLAGTTPDTLIGQPVDEFLMMWDEHASYSADEWVELHQAFRTIHRGTATFAHGHLNALNASTPTLEWAVMTAQDSGERNGGALLVLRDVTAAREAERLRHDLTHMIVHDLRSPLSNVMASIDMLNRGVSGDLNDRQRNVLRIAYASSTNMLDMISTLLDISRLEDGKMPLKTAPCSLNALAQQAITRIDTLARERSITISLREDTGVPQVVADADLLARVLQNLLANALKFSSRQHTVDIAISYQPTLASGDVGPFVCVSVRDQGVGIAPRDRDKIFAKFGQVGERRGGTGLGLTFCKLVLEAHGGSIWVDSAVGVGSTFTIAVPIQPREC